MNDNRLYIMKDFTYCIAHQDYTLQQRINFVENPGYLYYSNAGTFIPGTLENVLRNEEPQTHFRNDESDLITQDVVEGNILQMVNRIIELLRSKYLLSPIHYEGITRIEQLEIPEDVLREAICNAILCKCLHKIQYVKSFIM